MLWFGVLFFFFLNLKIPLEKNRLYLEKKTNLLHHYEGCYLLLASSLFLFKAVKIF